MFNVKTAAVEVSPLRPFTDASGAPATVSIGPYVYAADFLGEARLTLIRPVTGSRTESKIAASRARAAYAAKVDVFTTDEWRKANAAMYAPQCDAQRFGDACPVCAPSA